MDLTPSSCTGKQNHYFKEYWTSYHCLLALSDIPWNLNPSLYRLPVPRPGQVLGLVGTNGIGKSTALKVLAGKLKPNLGRFNVKCLMQHLHLCYLWSYVLLTIIIFVLCRIHRTGRKFWHTSGDLSFRTISHVYWRTISRLKLLNFIIMVTNHKDSLSIVPLSLT